MASAAEAIASKETEIAQLHEAKSTLETRLNDVYQTCKTYGSSGRDGRVAVDTLTKVFKENSLEAGLAT